MRKELSDAYQGLIEYGQLQPPLEINDAIRDAFIAMANLSSLARSPVTHDSRGQIEHIGDREAPTRMVKVIMQIWRACGVIGMTVQRAWDVIWRLSIGSIPKLRRRSLEILLQEAARPSQQPPELAYQGLDRPPGKGWLMTAEVANRLGHPAQTVLRSLQDMAAHEADRVVDRRGDRRRRGVRNRLVSSDGRSACQRQPKTDQLSASEN
jgi:hypothetical protein